MVKQRDKNALMGTPKMASLHFKIDRYISKLLKYSSIVFLPSWSGVYWLRKFISIHIGKNKRVSRKYLFYQKIGTFVVWLEFSPWVFLGSS